LLILLACISAMGFAFDLECSKIEKLWWDDAVLTCTVGNLTITNRVAVMDTSKYDDNDKIKTLDIVNQTVYYVPRLTGKMAKRLENLEISECGLKEIRKEDLQQFPQLKILTLEENDLEWLEDGLFEFNPELKKIYFSYNENLNYIGPNLLESLPKLGVAGFMYAGCIRFFALGREELEELKTKLKTFCKNETTKLKMLAKQTTTTTTTTESATAIILTTSKADENLDGVSKVDTGLAEPLFTPL
jgi:Leucine-rich repeat (LRR) protein